MIGGDVTAEFLRDVHDEVIPTRGAAAAEHDDSEHILEGLDECVDAFNPHGDVDATLQVLSESDSDSEDDFDDYHSSCDDADFLRDDDDDDGDDDDALTSPLTGDPPAVPPLRGGETPGTAAPALGSR